MAVANPLDMMGWVKDTAENKWLSHCNMGIIYTHFNKICSGHLIIMKWYSIIALATLISSCAAMHSTDPNSMFFEIPDGSTLSLNREITIPASDTHGVIQGGQSIKDDSKDDYNINCRLDFKKFGPRTIQPEKFIITRTEDGSNWVSRPSILRFYTELYLSSNKGTDVIKMVCQEYGGEIDRNFTVAEMQTALGDLITIVYP